MRVSEGIVAIFPRHPFVREAARDFRWIHIDGEHTAQAVSNDLAIAETLLSDRGILVLDDFFLQVIRRSHRPCFAFSMQHRAD